jgi:hypothetical protein
MRNAAANGAQQLRTTSGVVCPFSARKSFFMNDILTVPVRSVATDKKDVLRFSHLGQRTILGVNSIDSHFLLLRLKSRDKFNYVN